jgi:ferrous iron transport protein A
MNDGPGSPRDASLASARIGQRVRIVSANLDADLAAWIHAVGISPGEEVEVLRRATLGGPLHVRTSSGGEFAVAREIAARLQVIEVPPQAGPQAEGPKTAVQK